VSIGSWSKAMKKHHYFCPLLVAASVGTASVPASNTVAAESTRSESAQPASDAFLKGRVVSALAFNRHLSVFDFDAKVENGIAYIGGTVDSAIERDIAIETVRGIDEIRDVRSGIEVKEGTRKAQEESRQRSLGQTVDDAATTGRVKSRLLASESTRGLHINVSTRNGVVTLSGKTGSEAESDLATQIAENDEGVVQVKNELKTKKP